MLPMDKRYTVLVGNYGSGKTELAIAIARTQRAREPEAAHRAGGPGYRQPLFSQR